MNDEKGSMTTSPFKEEMLQMWLAGGKDATALDQWIFWNSSPLRHVPLVTVTEFFPEKFKQLFLEDPRVCSQVDRILRSKLSWSESVTWKPEDPLWEISLIAPERLRRLALLAAALSMKEVVAKIIDGAVVRKLRQEIGEDVMEFVLLSGSLSKYFLAECIVDFSVVEDPLAAIQERSRLFIENAFSAKELGVRQRIASKMPGTTIKTAPSPLASKTEEMFCKLWKDTRAWL